MAEVKVGDKVRVTDPVALAGYWSAKEFTVIEVPREFYGKEFVTIENADGIRGDFAPDEYEVI